MENKLPLISIVLPSYNGSHYLKQSVESCLEQTYKNIELILVDDCSSDETLLLMNHFAMQDKRVVVVHNTTNQRLPASLNIGFSYAQGDLLTWTSDDNFYSQNALLELYQGLAESNSDVVYAGMSYIDEYDNVFKTYVPEPPEKMIVTSLVGACFLYRAEVHTTLMGYNPGLALVEDYDFFLRAFLRGFKFIRLDKDLYTYRSHPKSLTQTRMKEILTKTYSRVLKNAAELDKFPATYHPMFWTYLINNMKPYGKSIEVLQFITSFFPQIMRSGYGRRFLLKGGGKVLRGVVGKK